MKTRKLVLGVIGLLAAAGLAGCAGNNADAEVDTDYVLGQPGTLADGFVSLANKHANAPLTADNTYVAGGHVYSIKDTFKTTYAAEPNKAFFNYLTNQWTINSYHYCNMIDGLVENDKYSNVVGALALGYKVTDNEDGTQSWKFQLRENAEWVDNKTGAKYANVKAQDFVTAAKYVLTPTNASSTVSILYVINNAEEYHEGEVTDFAQVGVKAISDYVVEYTLSEPTPYFLSMLTYSPFLPVNAEYLEERGSDFGKTCNDILVNGAFRITTHEYETKMVYTKNYHYYDRNHVYVRHVQRTYVPGTATPATTREWYESGVLDSFTVNAKDDAGWATYVTGGEGGTGSIENPIHANCTSTRSYGDAVYIGYWNFNRGADGYEYGQGAKLSDGTTSFSSKTDAQKLATAKAVMNQNFRLAFTLSLKATEYLKRFDPDHPENFLMRSYTNRELVSYNGKDYCDYVDDVWNEVAGTTERESLTGIIQGEDVAYKPDLARSLFAEAKDELKAGSGLTDADFPVYIDIIQSQSAALQPLEKAMYQAVEDASNGVLKIVYNLADSDAQDEQWGSETNNYDFSMWSGWGPDYADPKTYMHTFAKGDGDSLAYLGLQAFNVDEEGTKSVNPVSDIYKTASGCNTVEELYDLVFDDYNDMYETAAGITNPAQTEQRYRAFAEAEVYLIFGAAIISPWMSQSGYTATVSNTVAWQAGRASYGLTNDKFKNVVVANEVITKTLKEALTKEYNEGK